MVFSLPSGKASERVQVWRKLQKFGCLPFRNAGYLLPNTPENRERLIWICETVRSSKGEASVLEVASVDDLNTAAIQQLFRQQRDADYASLEKDLKKLKPQNGVPSPQLLRLSKRYDEIVAIDYFESKQRAVVRAMLDRLNTTQTKEAPVKLANRKEYQGRTWVTRPRPGIDRVSSAWLITRFIDAKPRFTFAEKAESSPEAVPYDMYGAAGFGHEGDHCTFETLCRSFAIKDRKVQLIAEAIHDADLEDHKYGRDEGHVINRILQGWARQGVEDKELLKRGMDLVEGLYASIA
jgi:hypothetical protein